MSFNSLEYYIFLAIITLLYFSVDQKKRWGVLLIASYFFYMQWNAAYALLIVAATVTNYFFSIKIDESKGKKTRKAYLIISLAISFGILFVFKYYNFFHSSILSLSKKYGFQYDSPVLEILLPVGISFYTFQAVGYTIDVYYSRIKPERHIGIFALYVSFFPQLVAGPIERAKNLLPQFLIKTDIDLIRAKKGIDLILWGLFKKVVVADRLAVYVNDVYNNVSVHSGLQLLLATYFFAFQIYCDFSGYSDIAIGSARILGYELMTNFKRPYFSQSVQDFWRRWHISLSTWFRDYLYVPLGGSHCSERRYYYNLLIVFVISGLWHGANWTFVLWGLYHGILMVLSVSVGRKLSTFAGDAMKKYPYLYKGLNIFITFQLVCFGWILFRANTISDALTVIKRIPINFFDVSGLAQPVGNRFNFLVCLISIFILLTVEFFAISRLQLIVEKSRFLIARWSYYYVLAILIITFGITEQSQFIYFQF